MHTKTQKQILPLAVTENLVIQELNDEILIYNLKTNKAFCLNRTSAAVWQLCDGQRSVGEISRLVNMSSNLSAGEDVVWLALKQLEQEKLISGGEEIKNKFAGLSRRAVIRNVGLASFIALPLISTLVAPTAAQAASAAAVTCTQPGGGIACSTVANCPAADPGDAVVCNPAINCCIYIPGGGIPGGGGPGGGGCPNGQVIC